MRTGHRSSHMSSVKFILLLVYPGFVGTLGGIKNCLNGYGGRVGISLSNI